MYIVMYITFVTCGPIQCSTLRQLHVHVHVQLTGTVDLWDYLPLGKVLGGMQGLQGRGGWSGGSCAVVS